MTWLIEGGKQAPGKCHRDVGRTGLGAVRVAHRGALLVIGFEPRDRLPGAPARQELDGGIEARTRKAMIERVRVNWIEGVFNKSLYHEVPITLGLEERPDVVTGWGSRAGGFGHGWRRRKQQGRFEHLPHVGCNSDMGVGEIRQYCKPNSAGHNLMKAVTQ